MRVPPVNCVTTKDCDSNNATLKTSECGKCINDSRPRHTLNKAVLEVDQVQYISNVCVRKLASLATTVQGLKYFTHRLVERETKFVQMFKIADNMWLQMESQYQNMIKASKENEAVLLDDVNKIEKSFGKYSAGCKNLENEFNEIKESEGKLRRAVEEKEDKLNCLTEQNAVLKRRLDILNEEIKMHGDNNDINKQKLMDIQNYAAQIKHLQSEIDYEEKNCMCIEGLYKERLTNMRVEIEKSYKLLTELNISNECYQSQINNELMDQHSILESIKRCSDKRDTDMARLVQNHGQKHKPLLKDHNRNELGTSVTDLEPICDTCTCGTICRNQCVCLYVKTRFLENIFDKISDVLYEELHTNLPTISEQIMGQNLESDAMRRNTEDKLKEFVIESVAGSLDDTIMAAIVKTNCEMTLEINNMLQDCVKRAVEGNRPHRPPAVNIYRFKDYGQGPSKEPKEEDECSIGCAGRNSRSQNKTAGKKKNQRTKSSEKRCCQKSRNVGIKTMVQGCNMAVDPCKCLPTESFGVKLMEQGAQMNFDACKCVPTEGMERMNSKRLCKNEVTGKKLLDQIQDLLKEGIIKSFNDR